MIRNERQYRPAPGDRAAQIAELQRASLVGQLAELDAQVREYEQLRAGQLAAARVSSLSDLPDALVRARIAAGLSQRELAGRLGMKEQQIQRYEADSYAGASLSRLREVMDALGVDFDGDVQLPASDTPLSSLRGRLRALGFDRRTVDQRLLMDIASTTAQAKVLAAS